MRSLLLKSFLVAVLIGPPIAFLLTVVSGGTTMKYEPAISADELRSYDNRPVSDLKAFLKSREVKLTGYRSLRESIAYAYFWKEIARSTLRSCIEIFVGCVILGTLERHRGLARAGYDSR